ncbi:MAG TPA: hypothetical protein ENI29_13095 [bacterium]|nr:hypothetical protein [bacterium]
MQKVICNINDNSCPCRVIDLDDNMLYCNFIENYVKLNFQKQSGKANHLINQVCPKIRDHIHHHDVMVERLRKHTKKFLDKIKAGEICFCTLETDNVIFLDYPADKYKYVKYKRHDGSVKTAPGFCFSIISKGNKTSEYKTKDESKAEKYSEIARRNGFRVEDERIGDTFFIKIYGDNQKDVDEFIANLNNDLILDDLYSDFDDEFLLY